MLKRVLSSSRYIMLVPVLGALLGSLVLMLYEMMVLGLTFVDTVRQAEASSKAVKVFAVGLVEAVDVFLIAIAVYIIGIGLYKLFIDDDIPLPKWLKINNFEDLKSSLISIVIAVLAVLFLREAVSWDGSQNILGFGIPLALMIAALSLFLMKGKSESE